MVRQNGGGSGGGGGFEIGGGGEMGNGWGAKRKEQSIKTSADTQHARHTRLAQPCCLVEGKRWVSALSSLES